MKESLEHCKPVSFWVDVALPVSSVIFLTLLGSIFDLERATLAVLLVVGSTGVAAFLAFVSITSKSRLRWYDWHHVPSEPRANSEKCHNSNSCGDKANSCEDEEWCYIKRVLDLKADPLGNDSSKSNWHVDWMWKRAAWRLGSTLLAVLVVLVSIFTSESDLCAAVAKAVTVPVAAAVTAAVTAAVAGVGIFLQVRQNTRSANRQKWINSIRKIMASLIDGIPNCNSSCWERRRAWREHSRQYSELELYLNPSEKVHRAFLHMIAVMYGIKDRQDCQCKKYLKCFHRPNKCKKFARRVRGITQLSNVLLKKEWEQVKKLA